MEELQFVAFNNTATQWLKLDSVSESVKPEFKHLKTVYFECGPSLVHAEIT